jgi:hypothetical protein
MNKTEEKIVQDFITVYKTLILRLYACLRFGKSCVSLKGCLGIGYYSFIHYML